MKRSMGVLPAELDWLTAGEAIALNDVVRLSVADTCLKAGDGETGYGVALIPAILGARAMVRKNGRATVVANGVVAVGDRVVAAGVVGPPDTRGRVVSLNTEAVHLHDLLLEVVPDDVTLRVNSFLGPPVTFGRPAAGALVVGVQATRGVQNNATGPTTGRVLGKALTAAGGAGVSLTAILEG